MANEVANEHVIEATNRVRVNHDVQPLKRGPVISRIAQKRSGRLALIQHLVHNPNLARQVPNWQSIGENIGYGSGWAVIQGAFLNSPDHRSNILDRDYKRIGVGTTRDEYGKLWMVVVFREPGGQK